MYRGTQSTSASGKDCLFWTWHLEDQQFASYPDDTIQDASNYCRNIGGDRNNVWCITAWWASEWEYCDVPLCSGEHQFANSSGYSAEWLRVELSAIRVITSICLLVAWQGGGGLGKERDNIIVQYGKKEITIANKSNKCFFKRKWNVLNKTRYMSKCSSCWCCAYSSSSKIGLMLHEKLTWNGKRHISRVHWSMCGGLTVIQEERVPRLFKMLSIKRN